MASLPILTPITNPPSNLRSPPQPANPPNPLIFRNNSGDNVTVYRIDSNGARVNPASVANGATNTVFTDSGHHWVVVYPSGFERVYMAPAGAAMVVIEPDVPLVSGQVYYFFSFGNELPLCSWGDASGGGGIAATRSDYSATPTVAQWKATRTGNGRWTLLNMWYPASHGYWYLSNTGGGVSIATTPFEWEIVSDPVRGHRIRVAGSTKAVSSVGGIGADRSGNAYVLVSLQGNDPVKDSQRWRIASA